MVNKSFKRNTKRRGNKVNKSRKRNTRTRMTKRTKRRNTKKRLSRKSSKRRVMRGGQAGGMLGSDLNTESYIGGDTRYSLYIASVNINPVVPGTVSTALPLKMKGKLHLVWRNSLHTTAPNLILEYTPFAARARTLIGYNPYRRIFIKGKMRGHNDLYSGFGLIGQEIDFSTVRAPDLPGEEQTTRLKGDEKFIITPAAVSETNQTSKVPQDWLNELPVLSDRR